MLTDGSFHVVREYRREGDRARYYSVGGRRRRFQPRWWTGRQRKKASAETEAQQQETVERLQATRADDVAATIGLGQKSGSEAGRFSSRCARVLRAGRTNHPDHGARIGVAEWPDTRRGQNITGLRSSPLNTIRVAGKRAKIRVHVGEPEFYIRTDDGRNPRLTLVRAEVQATSDGSPPRAPILAGTVKYEPERRHPDLGGAARVQR